MELHLLPSCFISGFFSLVGTVPKLHNVAHKRYSLTEEAGRRGEDREHFLTCVLHQDVGRHYERSGDTCL